VQRGIVDRAPDDLSLICVSVAVAVVAQSRSVADCDYPNYCERSDVAGEMSEAIV
jgi:hypothetical protein